MLEKLTNYLLILSTSIYLLYSYIMFVSNDKVISEITKVDNKVGYAWNKKTRLALLLEEFSNTPDCMRSYEYITGLVNGTDLNLNPS